MLLHSRLVARAPLGLLRALGVVLGFLVGDLFRIRRRHVVASMRRARIRDPEGEASAMYRALGVAAMEFVWMAATRRDLALAVTLEPRSRARLEALRGRGFVIAATHTGNWDLAACSLPGVFALPVTVVTKRLSMKRLDAYWQRSRAAYGVRLVPPEGALTEARRAIDRGEAVVTILDQVPGRATHGVRGEFLGAPVWIDKTPATLAARMQVPLAVVAMRGARPYELCILDVLSPPPRGTRGEARRWIREASRRATRALERFVEEEPKSWLWMHRRWKEPETLARRAWVQ